MTEALPWLPERGLKHQPAGKCWKTWRQRCLECSPCWMQVVLACACGIMGLDVPKQMKGNHKLLLKYILRQLNSEDIEGSDDGGCSWYVKLHDQLRVSFSEKAMHLSVSNKNLN